MKKLVCFLIVICFFVLVQADITVTNVVGGSEEIIEFKRVDEGENISFKVSNDSPTGNPNVRNLPRGAIFNSTTGDFFWTPDDKQAGLYNVVFYINEKWKSVRIIVSKFSLS